MTEGRRAKKSSGFALPDSGHYEVGYRKPPTSARFQKGASGNPKGRPKGSKGVPAPTEAERLKEIIKAEAYRSIRLPDAAGSVSMTMAEAVMRSISVNAAKGNARAQRLFTELLQVTERDEARVCAEYLETVIDYKISWEEERERRARLGLSGPEPIPHPDDIIIDMRSGRVQIWGPMTHEEKATWDKGLAYLDNLQEDFTAELKMSKGRKNNTSWRGHAAFTQYLFDRMNNVLPLRYQKQLVRRIFLTREEQHALEEKVKETRQKKRRPSLATGRSGS